MQTVNHCNYHLVNDTVKHDFLSDIEHRRYVNYNEVNRSISNIEVVYQILIVIHTLSYTLHYVITWHFYKHVCIILLIMKRYRM